MTTTFHRHWRNVPQSAWRWPNFSPAEIACRGTGKLLVNEAALAERLETSEETNDVQRRMLEAAARRPRSRDDLAERLRDGRF